MTKSVCATQTYFTSGQKHDEVKHLRLCMTDWTRRLKSDEFSDMPTSNCAAQKYFTGGSSMCSCSSWLLAFLSRRDASRHMSSVILTNRNCAPQTC